MTLEEKGPIAPPPVLSSIPQIASAAVQGWDGVISATHWDLFERDRPDGADFYVGVEELGHIHLDGSVHLATGSVIGKALLDVKLAKRASFGGVDSVWVAYPIKSEADAQHAVWLFRLNYDRLKHVPAAELLERITRRAVDM